MDLDYVSLGEVMIQFNATTPGPLRSVVNFEKHVAGSEANVMVGLRRLGLRTGLITRVGNDEFGAAVLSALRGEDVDTSHVAVDPNSPTGIYFTQRHFPIPGESLLTYYRHGSAASRIGEDDVDDEYVVGAKNLHITGITPALSDTCSKAVSKAFKLAIEHDLGVSFDTNIRPTLWGSASSAVEALSQYLKSKLVFTNAEDLRILYQSTKPAEAAARMLSKGAGVVVVKLGHNGAYGVDRSGHAEVPAFVIPHVEDVIGAGDAFDAAFIASHLKGLGLEECLRRGNAAGALVASVRGDMEALPRPQDLEAFLKSRRE